MIRKIIKINEDKCIGCGLCVNACHEGAIEMVGGKAKLTREDYCDGLGNCLPACPVGAISFEEREAQAFDKAAAQSASGCPGMRQMTLKPQKAQAVHAETTESQLRQWPVQIKLAPVNAQWLKGANLLIAADCTAYAFGGFHERFMKNRVTLIGCPKLDEGDYSDKLTAILSNNEIKSVTVVRMEVPCCAGIANAAITALKSCGKMIPWNVVTISVNGNILDD